MASESAVTPISDLSDEGAVRPDEAMNLTVALRGLAQIQHLKPLGEAESPVMTRLGGLAIVCANRH